MKTIIDIIFLFVGKYIKGYKTIILAVATFIVGFWEWLTGAGLFQFLCSASADFQALVIFCNITEAKFYASILMVIGVLNAIIRKLTDGPIGEGLPSSYNTRKPRPWLPFAIAGGVLVFVLIAFVLIPWLLALISNG